MLNNLLLNSKDFKIDEIDEDGGNGAIYCKRLIEKWTPPTGNRDAGGFYTSLL